MKTSDRVIKNTIFNYAGFIWRLLVSFFLIAYILGQVGKKDFGIFVLLETMVTCLALLDLTGVEGAFVKYISEFHTKNDNDRFNQIVSLGFTYYFLFQSFLCILILSFKVPLLRLFKFEPGPGNEIDFLLIGFLLISLTRGSFRVFRSVLLGLQRMDLSNLIDIIITVPKVAGTILFLSYGWGLKGLVINGLLVAVLTVVLQIILAYRIAPSIKFRPFAFSREICRQAVSYGIKIQVARFSELINAQVDKILLGLLIAQNSQVMVGLYELGAKPARSVRDLPSQFLPAILPAASQLDSLNDKESLNKLYYRGTKYLAILALPLTVFVVVNADLLIGFWLGPGYPKAVIALQVLSIGYLSYLLVGMGRLIARGMGVPQYEMRSSLLITVLNVLLSAVLIIIFGFNGALLGTAGSALIGAVYFMFMFHRHLGDSFWRTIGGKVYPLPLTACAAGALGGRLFGFFDTALSHADPGRMDFFLALLPRLFIFLVIYAGVLFITKYFDRYDREVLGRGWSTIKRAAPGVK